MTTLDPHIFRAYDIRGKVDGQMTEQAAYLIGKGFGSILRDRYEIEHPTVAVGRDARTHSPNLQAEVTKGLISTGCNVIDIGETPSPINYFTICDKKLDGGMQVTASHNPSGDNGLKLQIRDAEAYSGDDIQKLRERIEAEEFVTGDGSMKVYDGIDPYLKHVEKMFKKAGKGIKVVIDAGNGIAGPAYTEALKRIKCDVSELYTDPDGTFPNHTADPSKWETLKDLQEKVKNERADIGIAFDGDGDRLGIIDETGSIRTADETLLLLAQDHLQRNPGKPIVFTVSCSSTLDSEVTKWGGKPIMCEVGHSFVEHEMRKAGSLLGGEQSGHFFCFENYYGFDDALVAALHVIQIMKKSGKPLSSLFDDFPKVYPAPEIRPRCPDAEKERIVEEVTKHFESQYPVNKMDGVRIDFGDGAWGGIRKSNTSPKLSICLEARSQEKLNEIKDLIIDHLRNYPEVEF